MRRENRGREPPVLRKPPTMGIVPARGRRRDEGVSLSERNIHEVAPPWTSEMRN